MHYVGQELWQSSCLSLQGTGKTDMSHYTLPNISSSSCQLLSLGLVPGRRLGQLLPQASFIFWLWALEERENWLLATVRGTVLPLRYTLL